MLPHSGERIIDNLPIVVYRCKNDKTRTFEFVNDKLLNLAEYSVTEVKSISEIIHPEDLEKIQTTADSAYQMQYRIITKSKKVKYVFDNGITVFDKSGKIEAFEGFLCEVNSNVEREKEIVEKQNKLIRSLEESEKKHKLLIEKSRDGIMIVQNERIQYLNPGFEKLMGYKMEEVIGEKFINFVTDPDKSRLMEYYENRLAGEVVPSIYETKILKKDGSVVNFEINIGVVEYQNEPAVIGTLRDISYRKKIENEIQQYIKSLEKKKKELETAYSSLEQSEKKLQEINASKDKFFSIIAHDLKSPFTTLLGISDFLQEEYDNLHEHELKELLSDLRINIKSVYNLLENLLEWSRLHIKQNIAEHSNFSLAMLCDFVFEIFKLKAVARNIKLENRIDKSVLVFADYNMVDTVVRNIVNNALKYTPKGGSIVLDSKKKDDFIITSIKDTGTGISEKIVKKLFKIDEHYTSDGIHGESGTGLGLILCYELLKHNNGRIWVESTVGKGSTFFIELPVGVLD